jgi:hypothetical protein
LAATKIGTLDFCYENSMVKIIANRNCPEMKLAGLTVGPFDEGNEYEVYLWVAKELAVATMVHFREDDMLDNTKIYRINFKEGKKAPDQITDIPSDFYPKLRRYLVELKDQATQTQTQQSEKFQEYDRTKQLARDIVNSRLRKIVALAATPALSDQVTKNLTAEERIAYDQICRIVTEWKAKILEQNGADKQ